MDKEKFLLKLRQSLEQNGQASLVEENISYYTNYINEQVLSGRSQEDVLNELGDPRMIAKTIIDMNENNTQSTWASHDSQREQKSTNSNQFDNSYDNNSNYSSMNKKTSRAGFAGCLIWIIIVAIIFMILRVLLSIAAYFIIPICIILLVVGLVRSLK